MSHHVVVIGASAGGLQALSAVLRPLPQDLRAGVLVAMHGAPHGSGVLAEILARTTALPVAFARNGDPIEPGRVYVARPDCHLIVTPGGLGVVHGPRENGFRPAIDPLFRTAARELGPRVIGVILSGALADGTFGLSVIKHHGGVAIVQDPEDAIIASMPLNAIRYVNVDRVLPAAEIGGAIEQLTSVDQEPEGDVEMPRRKDELEPQLLSEETNVAAMQERFGPPSALTCPDCGGALWEVQDGRVVRYQCHVGHQYAPDNLEDSQRDVIDGALWSAVRVLEEHAALKLRMAERAAAGGLMTVSQGFAEGARDAHEQAQRIRTVLFDLSGNGGNGGNGGGETGTQARAALQATTAREKSRARSREGRSPRRKSRR
jgi:two-component system chemotaxis response regulator CheB